MKEISDLYCRKCKIRDNSAASFWTVAYKVGKTKNAQSRDTKYEFSSLQNANPGGNSKNSKVDVEIERDREISGPQFFIDNLEDFVINHYFAGDMMYFDTKQEYFRSYHETAKKYDYLLSTLETKALEIGKLNDAYKELTDKQVLLLSLQNDLYSKVLDEIKAALNKFLTPFGNTKPSTAPKTSDISPNVTTGNGSDSNKIDISSDILVKDFILLKGQGKYMLMHKIYHKGKNPIDPNGGSWKVDINLNNKPAFQWHKTGFVNYGYKQSSLTASKVVKIFGTNILDYDDPNFDKVLLP